MSLQALLPGAGFVEETKQRQGLAPGAGFVDESVLTLYWAVVPEALSDYANSDAGAAQIRTGKDDTGAALEAGTFGSMPAPLTVGANVVDALLPPTTQLDPSTSYVIAWTLWNGSVYGGGTSTKVVRSAAFSTTGGGGSVSASQAETSSPADTPAAGNATAAARAETSSPAELQDATWADVPVLSNPGAIDILALSARPQVTVTY